MILDIENIIKKASDTVKTHRLDNEGEYTRWLWQNDAGGRKLGINEYGCADAINILYTIGEFPDTCQSREAHIKALQGLQNRKTGLFVEETHHVIHTTAHCIAALELFDAKPLYPLYDLKKFATAEGLYGLFESLDWEGDPWDASHQGAGIFAAMTLAGEVGMDWQDAYFDWLWENADPETGFWKKGLVKSGKVPMFHHLAGTFHYMFNHEYAHRPYRFPERIIDTCIEMYDENNTVENFAHHMGFSEVDWVYCITRASRQCGYRYEDCKRVLVEFAKEFVEFLDSVDEKTHDGFNDLHALFGSMCCLAELQQALPGMIRTKKPLKLVLDRRPFI